MTVRNRDDVEISVIITAHNEGLDLLRTVRSIRDETQCLKEVIVLDDGSTDDSIGRVRRLARIIRHRRRIGIASSRDEAANMATGSALAFLDGHQRLSAGCLDQCARSAVERGAIVVPDLCGFEKNATPSHGAVFAKRRARPPFGAEWKSTKPRSTLSPVSSLRAPAYVVPTNLYPKVRWSRLLQGWGGSEGSLSLKAFFSGVPILHLCGPIAYHKFKNKFHYEVSWDEIWRNHAIIARICFSQETWYNYWLPRVFDSHLSETTLRELESDAIRSEHQEFQQIKVRPDCEFWTRLLVRKVPQKFSSNACFSATPNMLP